MSMQSIAWSLMSPEDYDAYLHHVHFDNQDKYSRQGVQLAIMAQLGTIARATTNPEHKSIIGAVFHRIRRS
jgi:hypothetical protein